MIKRLYLKGHAYYLWFSDKVGNTFEISLDYVVDVDDYNVPTAKFRR